MLSIHWASSKALVFAKSNVPNYTKKRISLSFRHALPDEYASGESDKEFSSFNLDEQISWLDAEADRAIKEKRIDDQALSVGLHIRGSFIEESTNNDEYDLRRRPMHYALYDCVRRADSEEAEDIVDEMARDNLPAGARAFHALIMTYVNSGQSQEALETLKREYQAGIQPLPETYAAVVYGLVRDGNSDLAEAVYASHCRAALKNDETSKSWIVLVQGLFLQRQGETALELIDEGRSRGHLPNLDIYEYMVHHYLAKSGPEAALQVVKEIEARSEEHCSKSAEYRQYVAAGLLEFDDEEIYEKTLKGAIFVQARHVLPIIEQEALYGDMPVAEELLCHFTNHHPFSPIHPKQDNFLQRSLCHILTGYMSRDLLTGKELETKKQELWTQMTVEGLPRWRGYFNKLFAAAICSGDVKLSVRVFESWNTINKDSLMSFLSAQEISKFLNLLSDNMEVAILTRVLSVLRVNSERIPKQALTIDSGDRTFLTRWLQASIEEVDQNVLNNGAYTLKIDNVRIDGLSLCALNNEDAKLLPGRMSVREMRAELVARGMSFQGSKKEMRRRIEEARGLVEKPIDVEPDFEIDAEQDMDDTGADDLGVVGAEDAIEPPSPEIPTKEDEEEEDEEGETGWSLDLRARPATWLVERIPIARSLMEMPQLPKRAGAVEALDIFLIVLRMGLQPSHGDVQTVVTAIERIADPDDQKVAAFRMVNLFSYGLQHGQAFQDNLIKLADAQLSPSSAE